MTPATRLVREYSRDYGMLVVLVVLLAVLSLLDPTTLAPVNIKNLARQVSITAMFAAGETLVILGRMIDLSVGSVLGLSAVISAGVLARTNNAAAAIVAGLAVGAIMGALNGVLVAYARLAAFVVTLATLAIAGGLTLLYTGARPIAVENSAYLFLGQGDVAGIPMPIIITVVLYASLWFLLSRTTFGRYNYAIGGNEEAARLAGVPVERYKLTIFVVAGLIAGLSGMVLTARLGSGVPTLGTGYELTAITAVVLGGTSLFGGEGKIWGTIVGAAILALIGNGLNLLNVEAFYQSIVTGVVVIIAISLDRLLQAYRGR